MSDNRTTTLLLIRHGQSQANLGAFFAGHMDAPLTEQGILQAQKTADYIVSSYAVDAVYCSDLQRAFDTGAAVAARVNVTPHSDRRLREIDAGQWTGKTFSVLETDFADSYSVWLKDIGNSHPAGGESVEELAHRVNEALRQIAEENPAYFVGKVNVDEEAALAQEFGVVSIPTLIVMKNGEIINRIVGARPKAQILEMLEKA